MTFVILLSPKKERRYQASLTDRLKIESSGRFENPVSQRLIGRRTGDRQRARHPGQQHDGRLLTRCSRVTRHVSGKLGRVRLYRAIERLAGRRWMAGDFGGQGGEWAAVSAIPAMGCTEIRVDDRLAFMPGRCLFGGHPQPRSRLCGSREERLIEEMLLPLEVPVKATVRELEVAHQVNDGDTLAAAPTKMP
jgi:hypothetical protein